MNDRQVMENSIKLPYIVIIFSTLVWTITETLSFFHAVTTLGVYVAWIFVVGIVFYISYKKQWHLFDLFKSYLENLILKIKLLFVNNERMEKGTFFLLAAIVLAGITFVLALFTVPNNGDSLAYHLPRVCSWIENKSVSYYPVYDKRQLYYSPLSEYIILHIRLITGNDNFFNLVQWAGYVVSANMTYRIARLLNCPKMYAAAGTLLFMLSPIAIAESITTQTDLTSTAVFLIFVWFVLRMGLERKYHITEPKFILNIIACSISIGIGFLTKMSICFIMIPFLIWLGICVFLKKEKICDMIKACLIAGIIILVFASPSFVRNMKSFGSVLPMEETRLMTKTLNPRLILLNICKNLTYETVGDENAGPMYPVTMQLAEKWGVDIENPEITAYSGFWPKRIDKLTENYRHDNAGSQKLFLLFGISLIAGGGYAIVKMYRVLFRKSSITLEGSFAYVCFIASLFMFSIIRWQPWVTRLLLAALPLMCIFMMYIYKALFHTFINSMAAFFILFAMILVTVPSGIRSLDCQAEYAKEALKSDDRFSMYFFFVRGLEQPEAEIIEQMAGIVDALGLSDGQEISVGLLNHVVYEYPLWVELKKLPIRMRHVILEEEPVDEYPMYIIAMGEEEQYPYELQYGEESYMCIWRYDDTGKFKIYMKR